MEQLPTDLRKRLTEKYACYVLITCEEPSSKGEMNVEMSYEGEKVLASYLLEGAQSIMDSQDE